MWEDAMWLGVPAGELKKCNILEGDLTGRFAYYRYDVKLEEKAELIIDITANSRYRLWVNGNPVLSGPCKGDLYRHYYETVNISEYLKVGENVLAVQVLYCDPYTAVRQTDERASIFGVLTPGGGHRLAIEGDILNIKKEIIETVTTGKATWKVYLDGSFYLKSNNITENLGAVCEELDFGKVPGKWKLSEYNIDEWSMPSMLDTVKNNKFFESVGIMQRFRIKERPIPLMYENDSHFAEEVGTTQILRSNILQNKVIKVYAGETREVLLDAGTEVNGYPRFQFNGGSGGKVNITYFEKFVNKTKKIKKTDAENGKIIGLTDKIILDGENIFYEPFWYRTFRYIYIQIEAEDEDVTVYVPEYRQTGYPLRTESYVRSSEKWVEEVWEICVRTLENCMMETYMDCPYYEQMQFPMDTRLQALFNYSVSKDVRLARKALEDFHCSMTPEGLIHGKYPSAYGQIISTFSLHYIYMLKEYYNQTGDIDVIKKYLPDVDMILGYYDRKIGKDGLVGRLGYWEFVDWQKAWEKTRGTPAALAKGPSAIINLMYGYALWCAVYLCKEVGRAGVSEEYEERRNNILANVQKLCWDEERGLYREGPNFIQYSQHAQAWAVLNEMGTPEVRKLIMQRAMDEKDIIPCSFSTSYEWFRAMEKVGLYAATKTNMKRWAKLPEQGNTTCPEEPDESRSECHAWSALPIYELIRCVAGIQPGQPGWESARIWPHLEYLSDLEGKAVTPAGIISFYYKKEQDCWRYHIELPKDMKGIFIDDKGTTHELDGRSVYEFI